MAAAASDEDNRDFQLWLNDDVVLASRAIAELLACARRRPDSIVVGQLLSREGEASYGGFVRGRHPLDFKWVGLNDEDVACDTFNGNVVLISRGVVYWVPLSGRCRTRWATLITVCARAPLEFLSFRRADMSAGVILMSRRCARPEVRRRDRLRRVMSVKNLPPRAWWTLCTRHGGALAVGLFVKPYATALVSGARSWASEHRSRRVNAKV